MRIFEILGIPIPRTLEEQLGREGFLEATHVHGVLGKLVKADTPKLTPELMGENVVFDGFKTLGTNVAADLSHALRKINQSRNEYGDRSPAEIYIRETVESNGSLMYRIFYRTDMTRQIQKSTK